ncbi:hypothetical protein CPB84DRAFT_1496476 [Gymnopilus junonius]|uniref:Uncharacterized protein n=1 Tax=Gymnopilus junonius TaxID=109634 RepID=A0A9P5NZI0_GYMJU|nr:hypothetical protein CPB84DRAFT_1496476 [Gymnopilus junonius]
MAVMWGRTLVCVAEEVLRREREAERRREEMESQVQGMQQQQQSSYSFGYSSSNPTLPPISFASSSSFTTTTTTTTSSGIRLSPFTTSFSQTQPQTQTQAQAQNVPQTQPEEPDEPAWPPNSPFAAIIARRPPLTTRVTLGCGNGGSIAGVTSGSSTGSSGIFSSNNTTTGEPSPTPNELLQLAQDQFSRGILHMPHLQHLAPRLFRQGSVGSVMGLGGKDKGDMDKERAGNKENVVPGGAMGAFPSASASVYGDASSIAPSAGAQSPDPNTFSRAKELYAIASSVLLLAEKLPSASDRIVWAGWADSVLSQMN